MKPLRNSAYAGIDIGKTKVAAGLLFESGELLRSETQTDMERGGINIVNQGISLLRELIHRPEADDLALHSIGIGSSGVVDSANGRILSSGAIPNWENIEICSLFSDEFSCPAFLENDVNASALGEFHMGAAKRMNSSTILMIGTGVGCCTIIDNEILRGAHGIAGQIAYLEMPNGHTVNETYSGSGIAHRASTSLGRAMTTEMVFREGSAGCRHCKKVVEEAISGAALTVAWINNMINPEVIVLSGGIPEKQQDLIGRIRSRAEHIVRKYEMHMEGGVNLQFTELGRDAGLIGAIVVGKIQVNNSGL